MGDLAKRLAKAAARKAGEAVVAGAKKAVGPKVVASTSDDYCNRCRHLASATRSCKKPCCVNLRGEFTQGGTHEK